MTTKEYLKLYDKNPKPFWKKREKWEGSYFGATRDWLKVRKFNKELIYNFPWLLPRNVLTDRVPEDYDYTYTNLDQMPTGWRLAFGDKMVEELGEELFWYDYEDKYRIIQIKEKFGGLRWYDNGAPIGRLSEDYEEVTRRLFRPFPEEYDSEKYVMVLDHIDNYESMYDENGELKENAKEIRDRNAANAIEHYRKHKIIEKCKVHDIIAKYETLSQTTCICCGKPAKYITLAWISPFCEDCIKDVNDKYKTVEEYFGEE